LLQQRQLAHSQKEEQVILLREDDKRIETGRALKANWIANETVGSMGKPE